MLDIKPYENNIKAVCVNLKVKKLDIFGSAVGDNFKDGSDIDIIVDFKYSKNENSFDKYFELKHSLEHIFNRSVDIVFENSIKNPFLKESIDISRKNIYAA